MISILCVCVFLYMMAKKRSEETGLVEDRDWRPPKQEKLKLYSCTFSVCIYMHIYVYIYVYMYVCMYMVYNVVEMVKKLNFSPLSIIHI